LSGGLSVFLIWHVTALSARIRDVNARAAVENSVGVTLSSKVATVQQAIDRYLQQPTSENRINADNQLRQLRTLIEETRPQLSDPQQLDDLAIQLGEYNKSFQVLLVMSDLQKGYWVGTDRGLSRANSALAEVLKRDSAAGQLEVADLALLSQCQAHLYTAGSNLLHLVSEQQMLWGRTIKEQLRLCTEQLGRFQNPDDATKAQIEGAVKAMAEANVSLESYLKGIADVQARREVLLNQQGTRLKSLSDDISNAALQQVRAVGYELDAQSLQLRQIVLGASLVTLLLTLVLGFQIARAISLPLKKLVGATHQLQQGNYSDLGSIQRDQSEIGVLAGAFHQMAEALQQERTAVVRQQQELTERNQHLEQTYQELRQATQAREEMETTVRMLSVPVIPVLQGVIVLPLVGEIDTERAESMLSRLSEGVVAHRAHMVILDVTGVPFVDSQIVRCLQHAASSAKLLGARCVLVGITPEVAQTIVSSGGSLADFTTMADLRSATAYALGAPAAKR
jgi:anti-anti-sigma factor